MKRLKVKDITFIFLLIITTYVVYFDERLGAVHSKRWSKNAFLMFLTAKAKKGEKKQEICSKI